MRQKNTCNLLDIKLFLVITTILLSMCIGFLLAEAQETDGNENWQDAILLIPNGPSLSNAFSFYKDEDWFKFHTEQGAIYQIFTRPVKKYNLFDIAMSLFSDPTKGCIPLNVEIKIDGSAFIEWTSPTSGLYFIKVQAVDPRKYSDQEEYTMQVISVDYQEAHTIIHDVPDYSQSDFGIFWDCKAVAAACVLGYWDDHGYGLLVDSNPDRMEDMKRLVYELHEAMVDSMERSPLKVFTDENVREGIEFYCNIANYGNDYNFAVNYFPAPFFSQVIDEIENKRPLLYGVTGHSLWGNHWMVTVGYLETNTTEWTINHDNWSTTHKDIYIDWDEATDCIITIQPDRKEVLRTSYPDIYPIYQYASYPAVFPWLEPAPTFSFGMISHFNVINDVSIPTWSSSFTAGYPKYTNQFNLGRGVGNMWPTNPELYNDQRSMAGNINSFSFSPYGYDNDNDYSNINEYKNTSGYGSIISDPIQGAYLGTDLSVYSFMNAPSAFFSNSFFSPYQTFSPALGLLPYNVFSPFPSLSAGLFLFGLPF